MTVILDGTGVSKKIRTQLKRKASKLNVKPCLAAVIIGEDHASKMYVSMKEKACFEAGFKSKVIRLGGKTSEYTLLKKINSLNCDKSVHGILVQLPLPKHIDADSVFQSIDPSKDVDGFTPVSMGKLMAGDESMVAATPKGVMMLLDEYRIKYEGKEVVLVNHSTVVGKPLAMLFLNRLATVTVCHVKTKDLKSHTRRADILVSATGVPHLIKADMVKKGAVVVDVGVAKKDGKTVGDVDFEKVKNKCSYISPVPGGAGPMTIAALLQNTLLAAKGK
ncbi:MAG: bifunctional 5,10-methylenetetrahydrofolate dehydrogenase/5,10-methenyltetrahydrofolate cyclohydrolase [Candidatus Altiarchaeota archaeon]|nr:bifunctional 5,10-methylenetetrahydrofolate dehydrogenase/5,10-methenyltetrahydrofolate cyclohydrolase [Candidatus Altiarchaeota archaeon]